MSFNIRVSHRIYQGVLDSVVENKGNLLILGSGCVSPRGKLLGRVLDSILQEVPCDVGIVNIKGESKFKKLLLPTTGSLNDRLAFQWASWIISENKGKITLLCIINDESERDYAEKILEETTKDIKYIKEKVDNKILIGKNISKMILNESEDYDFIIMGASREGLWTRIRFGNIPEKVTCSSNISVLIVNKYEGFIRNWLRRFFAG